MIILISYKKLPAEAVYGSFEEKQAFNKDLNTLHIAIAKPNDYQSYCMQIWQDSEGRKRSYQRRSLYPLAGIGEKPVELIVLTNCNCVLFNI